MSKAKPTKQHAAPRPLARVKAAIAHAAQTASIPARVALLSDALGRAINAAKNEGYTVIWRESEQGEPDSTGRYIAGLDLMRGGHIYAAVVFKASADEDLLPHTGCDTTWHR
jgi:hypothetical protein